MTLVLGMALASCSRYATLYSYNFEHLYDPQAPLRIQAKVLEAPGPEYKIWLDIEASKIPYEAPASALLERYTFVYRVTSHYRSKDEIVADTLVPDTLRRDVYGHFHLQMTLPAIPNRSEVILVVKALEKNTDRFFVKDIPLVVEPGYFPYRYALFDQSGRRPYSGNYFRQSDTIQVRSLLPNTPDSLFLSQLAEGYPPALPAMSVYPTPSKRLRTEAVYTIKKGALLAFAEPGLYFLQEDTARREGITFLVMPNKFPRLTQAAELVSPIIYMTTRDERNKLNTSPKPKETLDQFWVEIAGTKDQARRVIRDYYEHVEISNRLFTHYKEGWKTDRGMVFIIFGKPQRVIKDQDSEEWVYERNGNFSEVSFVFVRKPTLYNPDNWELVRLPEYDRIWYGTVDQWRKGIFRR